jgi:hypothetical protein
MERKFQEHCYVYVGYMKRVFPFFAITEDFDDLFWAYVYWNPKK